MSSPARTGAALRLSWPDRTAYALAYAVNPLILPPLLFGLLLRHFDAPVGEIGWAVGVGFVFFFCAPLAYVVWMVRRRRAATIEIRDRTRRTAPLLVGVGSYAAAAAVLYATGRTAAALLVAVAGISVVNTLLLLLITLRWKISLHTSAVAGFASMLLFVAGTAWPSLAGREVLLLRPAPLSGLLILVGLLMWARVRVGAHTPGQVWGGTLFGLVVPYAELAALFHLGAFDAL